MYHIYKKLIVVLGNSAPYNSEDGKKKLLTANFNLQDVANKEKKS